MAGGKVCRGASPGEKPASGTPRERMRRVKIELEVNGRAVEAEVPPSLTLVRFLREELGLKGTRQGCGRGDCGSCTVLVDDRPVLSCITFAFHADKRSITTIEGIASGDRLSRIQELFVKRGAVQCGFCTPAMILVGESFLRANPNPTRREIREAISGVLCRCTGYRKIVDALEEASAEEGRR
jgi:carbon-monoxide dehydrogenase small subunit